MLKKSNHFFVSQFNCLFSYKLASAALSFSVIFLLLYPDPNAARPNFALPFEPA